jgi:protein-S-isoprenylcysteine O-methyltransferase Ste14
VGSSHSASPPPSLPDNAGVRFPPPITYLISLGAGFLIQYAFPVSPFPPTASRVAGVALWVAWASLMLGATLQFRRARTSIVPVRPTTAIVSGGPFRFTRNPIYLGLACLCAGTACWFNSLWPLVTLVPAVAIIHTTVILREERYLERKFGDEYRAYRRRVRRWI